MPTPYRLLRPGASAAATQPGSAIFLGALSHRIVFHGTPRHPSWLNRIELWLSILIRNLQQHGSSPRSMTCGLEDGN